MNDLFDLTGKVALVIGGAPGGIGYAQALGLARYGADVIMASSNLDESEEVANEIRSLGKQSMAIKVDVTQEQSVADMVKQAVQVFPRIDILVNDFSTRIRKPAVDFPVEEWQHVMDFNIRGTFICCQALGRGMVKQKSGKIINHSSVRGKYGLPSGYAAYCSSKGAIDTLTKTLACEWAKDNVLVNAIAPTFVETKTKDTTFAEPDPAFVKMVTDRIPLGRWGVPGDFVGPTIFLASRASDFVTGQILYVDGGVTTW
jgi:NAD(P)-dependent dehydrogenase (short-subunit alcohol dehydrogenase family)